MIAWVWTIQFYRQRVTVTHSSTRWKKNRITFSSNLLSLLHHIHKLLLLVCHVKTCHPSLYAIRWKKYLAKSCEFPGTCGKISILLERMTEEKSTLVFPIYNPINHMQRNTHKTRELGRQLGCSLHFRYKLLWRAV